MEEVWTWGCDKEDDRQAGYLCVICQRSGSNAAYETSKLPAKAIGHLLLLPSLPMQVKV